MLASCGLRVGKNTINGFRTYLDGELSNQINSANVNLPIMTNLESNLGYFSSGEYTNGILDEVRIWNVARSEEEIQEYMCEVLSGYETGLVAYYTMSNGSGSILSDNTENEYDGILHNMNDDNWIHDHLIPDGDGDQNTPYMISGVNNLYWLSQNTDVWDDAAYFRQSCDINMLATQNWDAGNGFLPIGNETIHFNGNYDGQFNRIGQLSINRDSTDHVGLFGYTNNAQIENTMLTNVNINGYDITGALIGNNTNSSVSGCSSSGETNGNHEVGGLVGKNSNSTISLCWTVGTVNSSFWNVGGMAGTNDQSANINNSYSLANVSATGGDGGGFVGFNTDGSTISNCYSTGVAAAWPYVGGFIGHNNATVTNSFWDSISCYNNTTGVGLGSNDGIVARDSYDMKTQPTFTNAGWDFTENTGIWTMEDGSNYISYPYLQAFIYDLPGSTPEVNPIPGLEESVAPSISTLDVTNICSTTASANGNITNLGFPYPTQYGVCWATTENPDINSSLTEEGSVQVTGTFTSDLSGLAAETTYYLRAYATNATGTAYGNQVTFSTPASFNAGAISSNGDTICMGDQPATVISQEAASGGDQFYTYKWQFSLDETFTNPVDISSSNSATYNPPDTLNGTRWFRRWAKDSSCQADFILSDGLWKVYIDTIPPTFTAPPDTVIYLDAECSYNDNPSATGDVIDEYDNCGLVEVYYQDMHLVASPGDQFIYIYRTWKAIDNCGNRSEPQTQTIAITDSTSPTAICQDITIYLDAAGEASIIADDIDNGSSDNCEIDEITTSVTEFTCADVCENEVTLTVEDVNGNSSSCVATVSVMDTISPTAICQDLTIYLDAAGEASIIADDIDNGSSDNCTVDTVYISTTDFTCADVGENEVTLTVEDVNGNSSSCVATVSVMDTISPAVICQDITIYLDSNGEASIIADDIDNGSSDNCEIDEITASVTEFTCADVGENDVTLTVEDVNGNSSSCVATVTVMDTISPTAICQDITIYLDSNGEASIIADDIDNGSTDNCEIDEITASVTEFTCADVGENDVTLTVEDVNGNSSSCVATVSVMDTISPTAICQDITIYLDAAGEASIIADDIDNGSSDNCTVDTVYISTTDFTCADVGENSVTLTVEDINGNSSSCVATVSVMDTISPTVICQDITIYLDSNGEASIIADDIDNGSSDNCEIDEITASVTEFTCADVGENEVTLTVEDVNGNSSSCVATVTVMDTISPAAICQDITIYLDAAGEASIIADDIDNGSSDNCTVNTVYISTTDFTCADVGENEVTLTVEDVNGNSSSCVATVSVLDTISPTAACQDITIYLDEDGEASIGADDIDNGSSDNCEIDEITASVTEFTCTDVGENEVTLTIEDVNGNSSSCVATVSVMDTISPAISCPADQNIYIAANCQIALPDYTALLSASDACGIASIVQTPPAGTFFYGEDAGDYTIEFVVTDQNTNVSQCSFSVSVSNPEAFSIDDVQYSDVLCNGASDGTITVSTTGAPSGLFYSIDGLDYSNTSGLFTGLPPGTYSVSAYNINDCLHDWSIEISITEPTSLVIDDIQYTDALNSNDAYGTIWIFASGGTPDYEYSIDNHLTWQSENVFTDLQTGDYPIAVRDANGCITDWGSTLHITACIIYLQDIDVLDVEACYGDHTGEIHIDVTSIPEGGLTYSIDGGTSFFDNDGDFFDLAASFYQVVVQSPYGCDYVAVNPIIVDQPDQLMVDQVNVTPVTECYGNTNAAIDVSASGGTGNILYSIDGGNNFLDNGGVFENLVAGTYNILISDEHDCYGAYEFNPVVIDQPLQITMSVTYGDVNDCAGNNDGFISIVASGGAGGYTYSIDGGNSWNSSSVFYNLFAGTYEVWAKDNLGCMQPYAANPVIIAQPDPIVFNEVVINHLTCFGAGDGEIQILATGGTGDLMFSIDGGGSYESNPNFSELDAGDYDLFIMDDNACVVPYEYNPVVINQPNEILISQVDVVHASCSGEPGSITIFASGGAGGLMYSVNNGATYQGSNVFNNLSEDTYIVKVKDADGCSGYYPNNPVVVYDFNPSDVTISASPGTEVCTDELVTLSASAYQAVSYSWSNGEVGPQISLTESIEGDYEYTCMVLNQDGCESEASIIISFETCIGIQEITSDELDIRVFPNPNDGVFSIEISGVNAQLQISILDFIGRLILSENIPEVQTQKWEKVYNFNEYERGVYFLRIKRGNAAFYKKILIQ